MPPSPLTTSRLRRHFPRCTAIVQWRTPGSSRRWSATAVSGSRSWPCAWRRPISTAIAPGREADRRMVRDRSRAEAGPHGERHRHALGRDRERLRAGVHHALESIAEHGRRGLDSLGPDAERRLLGHPGPERRDNRGQPRPPGRLVGERRRGGQRPPPPAHERPPLLARDRHPAGPQRGDERPHGLDAGERRRLPSSSTVSGRDSMRARSSRSTSSSVTPGGSSSQVTVTCGSSRTSCGASPPRRRRSPPRMRPAAPAHRPCRARSRERVVAHVSLSRKVSRSGAIT